MASKSPKQRGATFRSLSSLETIIDLECQRQANSPSSRLGRSPLSSACQASNLRRTTRDRKPRRPAQRAPISPNQTQQSGEPKNSSWTDKILAFPSAKSSPSASPAPEKSRLQLSAGGDIAFDSASPTSPGWRSGSEVSDASSGPYPCSSSSAGLCSSSSISSCEGPGNRNFRNGLLRARRSSDLLSLKRSRHQFQQKMQQPVTFNGKAAMDSGFAKEASSDAESSRAHSKGSGKVRMLASMFNSLAVFDRDQMSCGLTQPALNADA